jgi:metal-dependent protease
MKDKAMNFFKSLTSKQIILGIALAVLIIYVIRLNSLKNILIIIPALLIAITVHEFGHAFMARKYGDETSKGRITLNPFKHIDLIGLLSLFVCGIGWGKPVEIDPNNFKKNKIPVDRIEAIVSLAGPSANFITAILLAIILKLFIVLGIIGLTTNYLLFQIISQAMIINIGMAVFNLIPIPPLDGYKIVKPYIGQDLVNKVSENETIITTTFIIIILISNGSFMTGIVYNIYVLITKLVLL